jgi:sensor histidine kinase YesM
MHPLLKTAKQYLLMGLLWSPLCFWVMFLLVSLVEIQWWEAFWWVAPPMVVQLFFCLSSWYLCRMTVFSRWPLVRTAAVHIAAALLLTGLWLLLLLLYQELLVSVSESETWRLHFVAALPLFIAVGLSLYFIAILTHYLVLVQEKQRKAEAEAYQQKILAGQAELKALKATVHPHFLFNSLNLLRPLMRSAVDRAQEVVSHLSDFLLYSLRYGKQDRVTVKDEVEHVRSYLGIETVRLAERLTVEFDIDEAVLEAPMLPLTLLPLVENAIKHGISQRLEGGTLTIAVKKDGDFVHITVTNPFDQPTRPLRGEGMGLQTVKQRLTACYGRHGQLTWLKDDQALAFKAELRFPRVMGWEERVDDEKIEGMKERR